jgi:hypothetical protein
MTKTSSAMLRIFMSLCAGTLAWGQSPGHVNFFTYANSSFDAFTSSPSLSTQQWFNQHMAGMTVFSPYFDSRTSWYPNGYVYQDLYAIQPGSWLQTNHPEWIAHDQYGNWLYMPWNCSGGSCPEYAGDISNPDFRAWWISNIQSIVSGGGYTHLWIDDVNMEFRVGDGWGNQVAPVDKYTGQPMSYDTWRYYVAVFTQQIRAALPNTKIMHNSIWFADSAGAWASDTYIQQQIAAADYINLERGIASDAGLTGGTGFWSIYNFFNYVDDVHAQGKGVNLMAYQLNTAQQQYNLASYYLISNGSDFVGDWTTNPNNWWSGYSTELGTPLGPRTYSNGVFQRNFTGGMVILGEPGLGSQTVQLPGSYQTLDGSWVSSVTVTGWQGIVLLASSPGSGTPVAPQPPPAPPVVPSGSGIARYISDITPTYSVNGWGNVQINQSTNGNPLTINGVQYQHGLGAHAYSEQRWPLWNNCSTFTATVGVDGEVPVGFANVEFQVWGDGRLLYNSGFMQSGSPAASVNVNVSGVQTLGLVVTNGTYMAPSWAVPLDHSDWANPVIVCAN